MTIMTASNPQDAAKLIADETFHAIFADVTVPAQYEELEAAISDSVGLFSDKINANAIHFLSPEPLEKVQFLVQSPLFGHYVVRDFHDAAKELGQHYGRFVKATLQDRAFGLASLMKPGTKIQTVKLHKTIQKFEAVEAIKTYLMAAKFQIRMASVIANAVDELLMNAMFDAPVDELGKSTLSQMPRSTEFELTGKHAVEMQVGFDGDYVGITAIDLYGSLDKSRLLSHISKIYRDEEYRVRTAVAGAGIGLATVFRAGGSFFFASEAQARTEVTVLFKRTSNFREFKDQFKFISTQFYF